MQDEQGAPGLSYKFCIAIQLKGEEPYYYYNADGRGIENLSRHDEMLDASKLMGIKWTTPELAQLHEQAKESAGWYDSDFKGNVQHKEKKKQEETRLARHKRGLAATRLAFVEKAELTAPIPIPGSGTNHSCEGQFCRLAEGY